MNFEQEAVRVLLKGGVGVMPTDTIYGIIGSALSRKTVERIYRLRRRRPDKPMIVLIGSLGDLKRFRIRSSQKIKKSFRKLWPGRVSIILPCKSKKFRYLHRGTNTLAFRLPAKASLRALLRKTGPLVAPSANLEGRPSARNIKEAKRYFGKNVDFYVDAGILTGKPSRLIKFENSNITVLRK